MRQLALFTALQSTTEGIDTEFKSARGGIPGSFWASYATMANTKGGSKALRSIEKAFFPAWHGPVRMAPLSIMHTISVDKNSVFGAFNLALGGFYKCKP
jgi:hypothetical protein